MPQGDKTYKFTKKEEYKQLKLLWILMEETKKTIKKKYPKAKAKSEFSLERGYYKIPRRMQAAFKREFREVFQLSDFSFYFWIQGKTKKTLENKLLIEALFLRYGIRRGIWGLQNKNVNIVNLWKR